MARLKDYSAHDIEKTYNTYGRVVAKELTETQYGPRAAFTLQSRCFASGRMLTDTAVAWGEIAEFSFDYVNLLSDAMFCGTRKMGDTGFQNVFRYVYDLEYSKKVMTISEINVSRTDRDLFAEVYLTTARGARYQAHAWGVPAGEFRDKYKVGDAVTLHGPAKSQRRSPQIGRAHV